MNVCVIGAGVTGCATAWALSERGAHVTVVEQFEQERMRGSSHGRSRIVRLAYPDVEWVRLAQEAYTGWRELERQSGARLLELHGIVELVPDAQRRKRVECERQPAPSAAFRAPGPRAAVACRGALPQLVRIDPRFADTRHHDLHRITWRRLRPPDRQHLDVEPRRDLVGEQLFEADGVELPSSVPTHPRHEPSPCAAARAARTAAGAALRRIGTSHPRRTSGSSPTSSRATASRGSACTPAP
jgi:hypothetical protein